jgi:glycosyltransferase involved in cell wall biosynthesis
MRVTIVQCEIPAYRQGVFDLLAKRFPGQLTLLAGRDYFDHTGRVAITHPDLRIVGNHFLARRRLLWQSGIWRSALAADVTVVELNPRILSGWVILLVRRVLRRRTLVWGHAWPRGGRARWTDRLRQLMRRLASGVVVYTHQQADELRRRMPGTSVTAAPNALYSSRDHVVPPRSPETATSVVYVGRLIEVKKPRLLLDAFAAAVDGLPPDMHLVFVGEGPLRRPLEDAAAGAGIADRVRFLGEVIAYDDLAEVYAGAIVSACPGYAGLSITQSYWFGVPAIIARDDQHSPEIEAAVEGENSIFVESDSVASLGRALECVATEREMWLARGEAISRACAERYSLEAMVDAMVSAITGAPGGPAAP